MRFTDGERRETARRLRESWRPTWHGEKMMHRLRLTLGIEDDAHSRGKYRYYRILAERLADLIEPSCDRDALLAIADDLERASWERTELAGAELHNIAWRIREACGEEEGA